MAIVVFPADPFGPIATEMIAKLIAELDARYADRTDDEAVSFFPEQATVPRSIFLIAKLDGEPMGCAALRPFSATAVEMKRMYVKPAGRGKGLGRALVAKLERVAIAFGYSRMILETGVRQPEALALYKSCGFVPIANYNEYANNPLSVCMDKDLGRLSNL